MSDNHQFTRRQVMERAAITSAAVMLGSRFSAAAASREPLPVHDSLDLKMDINGHSHTIAADPRLTLPDALREDLGFKGQRKAAITDNAAPARC